MTSSSPSAWAHPGGVGQGQGAGEERLKESLAARKNHQEEPPGVENPHAWDGGCSVGRQASVLLRVQRHFLLLLLLLSRFSRVRLCVTP